MQQTKYRVITDDQRHLIVRCLGCIGRLLQESFSTNRIIHIIPIGHGTVLLIVCIFHGIHGIRQVVEPVAACATTGIRFMSLGKTAVWHRKPVIVAYFGVFFTAVI